MTYVDEVFQFKSDSLKTTFDFYNFLYLIEHNV